MPDATPPDAADRRRHPRLPVTLSASIRHAGRSYRTAILDVSDGGLLLAPVAALPATGLPTILIEARALGAVRARIVGVSRVGMHAEIAESPERYHAAIRRLADLTQAWNGATR